MAFFFEWKVNEVDVTEAVFALKIEIDGINGYCFIVFVFRIFIVLTFQTSSFR